MATAGNVRPLVLLFQSDTMEYAAAIVTVYEPRRRGVGSFFDLRRNLWLHSLIVCAAAVLILTASRTVGAAGNGTDLTGVFIHSVILVAVSYPFQTLFASSAMSAFSGRIPLSVCAIAGCFLAAFPAAILSPSLSWLAGVMPTGSAIVETRQQFFENVASRLHFIFFGFATLGPLLWMLLNFRWWVAHLEDQPPSEKADSVPNAIVTDETRSLQRKLPPEKRGRLLAISAEQHYVRIHTNVGDDLVLMPFSEAVGKVPSEQGMRIHRSHWISYDAVQALQAAGNNLSVQLENDIELPVSRSFSGAVREELAEFLPA